MLNVLRSRVNYLTPEKCTFLVDKLELSAWLVSKIEGSHFRRNWSTPSKSFLFKPGLVVVCRVIALRTPYFLTMFLRSTKKGFLWAICDHGTSNLYFKIEQYNSHLSINQKSQVHTLALGGLALPNIYKSSFFFKQSYFILTFSLQILYSIGWDPRDFPKISGVRGRSQGGRVSPKLSDSPQHGARVHILSGL